MIESKLFIPSNQRKYQKNNNITIKITNSLMNKHDKIMMFIYEFVRWKREDNIRKKLSILSLYLRLTLNTVIKLDNLDEKVSNKLQQNLSYFADLIANIYSEKRKIRFTITEMKSLKKLRIYFDKLYDTVINAKSIEFTELSSDMMSITDTVSTNNKVIKVSKNNDYFDKNNDVLNKKTIKINDKIRVKLSKINDNLSDTLEKKQVKIKLGTIKENTIYPQQPQYNYHYRNNMECYTSIENLELLCSAKKDLLKLIDIFCSMIIIFEQLYKSFYDLTSKLGLCGYISTSQVNSAQIENINKLIDIFNSQLLTFLSYQNNIVTYNAQNNIREYTVTKDGVDIVVCSVNNIVVVNKQSTVDNRICITINNTLRDVIYVNANSTAAEVLARMSENNISIKEMIEDLHDNKQTVLNCLCTLRQLLNI